MVVGDAPLLQCLRRLIEALAQPKQNDSEYEYRVIGGSTLLAADGNAPICLVLVETGV